MKKKIFNRALLCISVTLLLSSSQAQTKEQTAKKNAAKSEVSIKNESNVISTGNIVNYKEDGHTYSFNIKEDKITDLYIDGKRIPEKDYPKYKSTISRILEQIKKDKEKAQLDMMKAQQDQKQAKVDMEEAQLAKQKAEQDMIQAKVEKQQAEQDKQRAMKDQERAMLDKMNAEEDKKILNSLLTEIVSEKIVSSEENISSVTLNSSEFIVNGKRQSSNLHQKFKTKYLKDGSAELKYQHNGSGRQFNIQKGELH